VTPSASGGLESRVITVAQAALAERGFVTAIDVLVGLGWLTSHQVQQWRQGRVRCLEAVTQANLGKISTSMRVLRRWAEGSGLKPSETAYLGHTRDRRPLQFSKSGDADIERAYRTHWVSPQLTEAKRQRLAETHSRAPDLLVIAALGEWTCTQCSGTGDLLFMEEPGPICLECADLDHMVFLPAGDAVTRTPATTPC
jgi:hypothetical protein